MKKQFAWTKNFVLLGREELRSIALLTVGWSLLSNFYFFIGAID